MSDTSPVRTEELVVRRIIEAPIELVWRMWTEPELVKRWWGPKYYTSPHCSLDLRVGGRYVFAMRAPAEQGGGDSYTAGTYTRIEPMRLLEFTQSLSDRDGNPIEPASIGMPPDFPREMRTVVEFEAKGELTRLSITTHGWTAGPMFVYAFAGVHQQIDKLEACLK